MGIHLGTTYNASFRMKDRSGVNSVLSKIWNKRMMNPASNLDYRELELEFIARYPSKDFFVNHLWSIERKMK